MKASTLFRQPSFFKGMARVVDLFGKLDEYAYSEHADLEQLHRDWKIVGTDLHRELKRHERRFSHQAA